MLKTTRPGPATAMLVVALSLSGAFSIPSALAAKSSPFALQTNIRLADFGSEAPSPEARHVADWVADSRDNGNTVFIIVD